MYLSNINGFVIYCETIYCFMADINILEFVRNTVTRWPDPTLVYSLLRFLRMPWQNNFFALYVILGMLIGEAGLLFTQ